MEEFKEEFLIHGTAENEEWTQLPNNKIHGVHICRSKEGTIISLWKDGERHGETLEYENNKLVARSLWDNGAIKEKQKFDADFMSWKAEYKEGKLHGLERSWINGKLYTETDWVEGKMHGQQRTYNNYGKLCSTSYWDNNVPTRVDVT
ncbi:hypothetical protein PMV_175 [Port-miou virus]|nr:hypothetical protein PMV_175 [Port-miou virus]